MQSPDLYSYFLTVEGNRDDQLKVFELLSSDAEIVGPNGYLVPDNSTSEAPYRTYSVPERHGAIYEWDEMEMDLLLHTVAVQVPGAVLTIEGQNEDDKSKAFEKRFHGDRYQETRMVTTMPPLLDGGDIPFAQRHANQQNIAKRPIYFLNEEREDEDGIRSFEILAVSDDKDSLRQLLQAKIEKDEYGFIAEKGIDTSSSDYFSTQFDNGFVAYYIGEKFVCSREETLALLQTKEYISSFDYPEFLQELLLTEIADVAYEKGYDVLDADKAVEAILNDPKFHSMIIREYADFRSISPKFWPHVSRDCYDYISSLIEENPSFFESIGAVEEFVIPEGLEDLLIDAIYNVSRDLHIPVYDATEVAMKFTHNSGIREAFKNGISSPESGAQICYDIVKIKFCTDDPELSINVAAPKRKLDSLIADAKNRSVSHGHMNTEPSKGPDRS